MAWLSGRGPREVPSSLWSPRRLPGIEDKFLEIASIHQFLELSPERKAVHGTIAHTVVKSAILLGA